MWDTRMTNMETPAMEYFTLLLNIIQQHCNSCLFFVEFCTAIDTITFSQSINNSESITCNSGVFTLGFFNPVNSTNRYLGIWYSFSPSVVVWVANRDKPLRDSSGILKISEDGNLVVVSNSGNGEVLWSSNVSYPATNPTSETLAKSNAELLDSGNFVLKDYQGKTIWESFLHPTDTFLPTMKLIINSKEHSKVQLTSWKSISDPSIGSFSAGMEPRAIPEGFVMKRGHPIWRTGPWNGQFFLGTFDLNYGYHDATSVVDDKEGTVYVTFDYANNYSVSRFALNWEGILVQSYWDIANKKWVFPKTGISPLSKCETYGTCGAFGFCYILSEFPACRCLRGFEPKNVQEWNRGNWSSGCVRRTPVQCEKSNCQELCLNNCTCTAYAYDRGIGCMTWNGDLIDLIRLPTGAGSDLYVRLAYSDLPKRRQYLAKIITVAVIIGIIVIATSGYFLRRWIYKQRVTKRKSLERGIESLKLAGENMIPNNLNQVKLQNLQLFTFEKLASATNNFSPDNLLGKGGFGPVYRGKLENESEVAVKRLSRASGQGLVEFTNEVVVISELQHRNLVSLLGCCIDGEERMLIYEFMPNKSLDAFIFDPVEKVILDWRKRFGIIEGIGRGLLYLHRDSRLKIIHRDLKPSNILLDKELNPKISDFGMARIFGGNEDHANTKRVVGTYGYMSPEYAINGLFSEKSDVFSFGVLLLEIVSGRRNNNFHRDDEQLSLLELAWKLWNQENNIIGLIDRALICNEEAVEVEIKRCIQVGLLCVQESARDRPTMPTILSMLNSEIVNLATPKKPAFTDRHIGTDTNSSQLSQDKCSNNNISVTTIHGR
ncbi:hypothetical protein FNV43_RR07696 [Rhamnella rubrinervis]|uniref:Receptor-like serine/threonine-protein kinase n=1 Tax=Rhamnella rubrinervis TaxID=2594499 RepID=A0A8K0HFR6_9ROSA|nr:hypothetical protein FNV43_RR07696 [Rhamnella rubrinervis]